MRFLSIYKTVERNTPPTAEHVAQMTKLIEEGMRNGTLISTEGCLPTALGARVRQADGKVTVTDGPFTESKEVVGGYALIEASSYDEALVLATRFMDLHRIHWPKFEGECEVRPLEANEPPQ